METKLDDGLDQLGDTLNQALQDTLRQTLDTGLDQARGNLENGVGPTSRSGFLAASLGSDLSASGDGYLATLYSDASYAPVQEFGAFIQARQAAYLKFQVQGQWVQVKSVTIPARPFLSPGFTDTLPQMEGFLAQALD